MLKKQPFIYIFIIPGIIALAIGFWKSGSPGSFVPIDAVPTIVVNVGNGGTYDMTAEFVTKTIDGKSHIMLAYNKSIPGPVLRVRQGDTIYLRLTNKTDTETLLHAHGIRLENAFDGTHLVQDPIPPGGTFTYKLTFPDPGIYWYHPHIREDLQQDLGLAGNFLVIPDDPNYWGQVNREEVIILDDVLIEEGEIAPHSSTFATHALMGRFGNTMLANGDSQLTLPAAVGEVVRYYLTNAANVRTFAVTHPGVRMKLIGADNGKYQRESFVDRVILSPSERAVVDVWYEYPKSYTFLHDPGNGAVTHKLFEVDVETPANATSANLISYKDAFLTLRSNEAYAAELGAYRRFLSLPPDKTIQLSVDVDMNAIMSSMMSGGMGSMSGDHSMHMHEAPPIEWEDTMGAMNVFSTDETTHWIIRDITDVADAYFASLMTTSTVSSSSMEAPENEEVNWEFGLGDVVKIRIFNDPNSAHPMQHPIHLHGQRFLVLARNGVPTDNLVWKDTALIETGEIMDIVVPMENPGHWMLHCHIGEHLTSGMMVPFWVKE